MVVEAIKALFGSLPSASGPLFAAPPVPEEGRKEVLRKTRAWRLVSHEAKQALPAIPGAQVPAPACPINWCCGIAWSFAVPLCHSYSRLSLHVVSSSRMYQSTMLSLPSLSSLIHGKPRHRHTLLRASCLWPDETRPCRCVPGTWVPACPAP